MLRTHNASLVEAFVRVLETMAFISPEPREAPVTAPPDLLLGRIEFSGPLRGAVEVVASEAFGALLAANVLGTSPAEPDAADRGRDAIKELVNVTCGALLASLASSPTNPFEVNIPRLSDFRAGEQWTPFVTSRDSACFDADGHTVAIRVTGLD